MAAHALPLSMIILKILKQNTLVSPIKLSLSKIFNYTNKLCGNKGKVNKLGVDSLLDSIKPKFLLENTVNIHKSKERFEE